MNKILKTLMLTFAFSFGAFAMASCNDNTSSNSTSGTHVHDLETEWSKDATKHWHACKDCDEKVDKAAHTWGEWIEDKSATDTEKGSHHRICSICLYRADEEIPMLSPEFGAATELTAIYAKVPTDWETVNIYYWGADIEEGYAVGWPGNEMTLVNADEALFGYKIPAGTDHVIINNGSVQTVDLEYAPSRNLLVLDKLNAENKYEIYYSTYTPTDSDPELAQPEYNIVEKITVYAQVPTEWEKACVHHWGSATSTDWPGEEMTLVDADKHIYSCEVPADITGIIFTNGAPEGTIQTVNLELVDGANAFILTTTDAEGHFNATVGVYENGNITQL